MRMHHEPVVVIVTSPPDDAPFVWTPLPRRRARRRPGRPGARAAAARVPRRRRRARPCDRARSRPARARIGFDEMTSPMIGVLPGSARPASSSATRRSRPARRASSRLPTRSRACATRSTSTRSRCTTSRPRCGPACVRTSCRRSSCATCSSRARRAASSTRSGASRRCRSRAGTLTANGDVGFPLASNDRFLREGDLILCDTGITWMGYHSDFGKTWICSVDPKPTRRAARLLHALV